MKKCGFCAEMQAQYEEAEQNGTAVRFGAMLMSSAPGKDRIWGADHGYFTLSGLNFCPECGASIRSRLRQWRNSHQV